MDKYLSNSFRAHLFICCISFRSQVMKVWKNEREQYLRHWWYTTPNYPCQRVTTHRTFFKLENEAQYSEKQQSASEFSDQSSIDINVFRNKLAASTLYKISIQDFKIQDLLLVQNIQRALAIAETNVLTGLPRIGNAHRVFVYRLPGVCFTITSRRKMTRYFNFS